jgi:hypothetical protein
MDVNEWIHNECAECVLPRPNIRDWFTRSHPSKGENRTRNRSEIARVNWPYNHLHKLNKLTHTVSPCNNQDFNQS